MTARTTTVGTAVTQQALTGSCQPFTTAVSPSYWLSTAIFHPSPTSSTWTAGVSIGRTGGRHSVYTCHCQREGKTCLGLEQGQLLRPALKPKQYVMHTHVQQSPLPCTRSIWEPWHQPSSYAGLHYSGFNPNGKRTSPLSLLQGARGQKQDKSRGKADLQAISQPQAPVLGLLNWKQQHRAVTRPVSRPCTPGPALPPGLQPSTGSTFWLQLSGDCHLHASHTHGELGHPQH